MQYLFLSLFLLISAYMRTTKNTTVITDSKATSSHLKTENSIRDVVNHPAFRAYGNHLLPWEDNSRYLETTLQNVGSLMPYHSNVKPQIVVDALNYMIDQLNDGVTIFYNFYSEQQRNEDPPKAQTGLFFFKGETGAPFAIICPGGGFSYVGSLHEGFPLAVALNKKGYNAFVIKYRLNNGLKASQDLAAVITYIFAHAAEFEVDKTNYSLWGGSAGARMVGDIALSGVKHYGKKDLPGPTSVVIAYTGDSTYSPKFPPTFITVSADDPIANVSVVERRVENLKKAGVKVAYHRYEKAGHGFGTGVGTDAEGWMNHAIDFWERSMVK